MGFMDKAKKMAQDVQQQAKDGTLKERAQQMAQQAQSKIDEVQGQFNAGQGQSTGAPAAATQYDQHGRPITPEQSSTPPAGDPLAAAPATPPGPPAQTEAHVVPEQESATPPAGDPLADAAAHTPPPAPKAPPAQGSGLTGGDPLAG